MVTASTTAELPLDLRLVEVALEVLESDGLGALSLREIARRAGVSHGAPLRHFDGLRGLRSEVAARGFALLADTIQRAADDLPPGAGAHARMVAAGRAYVALAIDHSDLFALMFQPLELDPDNPAFVRCADAAFEQLLSHVRAAQDTGWNVDRDTRTLAGATWACVHGLATLWSQGALQGAMRHDDLEAILDTTLELALRAPAATKPFPRTGDPE